jgi:hypothetical protein
MSAGYSKRSLVEKLGIKPGMNVALVAPDDYADVLGALPGGVQLHDTPVDGNLDLAQLFARGRAELEAEFPRWKAALKPNGALWVSWLKGKAGGELNENVMRDIGLSFELVDVKMIAVDARWSGLKFVYRLHDRPHS